MRRLAVLIGAGAAFFALAAVAYAVANQVTFTSKVSQKTRSTASTAANASYNAVLNVSGPGGTLPDTASVADVFFAKQLVRNGKLFKSCKASEINGKATFPSKCKAATIGRGTATAQAGPAAGQPAPITENLTVTVVNGPRGNSILLVLKGTTPLPIQNRVINGKLSRASGAFGFKAAFKIPPELQTQLGLKIALTHFNVTISKTVAVTSTRRARASARRTISYLQVKGCPRSHKLPTRAVIHFNTGQNGTANSTYACK